MADSEEEEFEDEGLDPNIREQLHRSRQMAKDLDAANKRAAQAEREAAFAKAGVPDTPLVSVLAKSYEGENDPASVKAYFDSLGVDLTSTSAGVSTAQTPEPEGTSEAELQAQRQVSTLGAGGEPGGDVDFADVLKSGKNAKEVLDLIASAPQGANIGIPQIS
jgi:hypothetical protein